MKRLLIWLALIALVVVFRQYGSFFGDNSTNNTENTATEKAESYNPAIETKSIATTQKIDNSAKITPESIKNVPADLVNKVIEQKQAQNQIVEASGVATMSMQEFITRQFATPAPIQNPKIEHTQTSIIQKPKTETHAQETPVLSITLQKQTRPSTWTQQIPSATSTPPKPQIIPTKTENTEYNKIETREINLLEQGTRFRAADFSLEAPNKMYAE